MELLDKLLFNLQTLSTVPKGKRISVCKEFLVIEDDSILQGAWRWKNGDSRDKAVAYICREIRTVILLASYIAESYHLYDPESPQYFARADELRRVRVALDHASGGIDNLCITYNSDANVVGNLVPLCKEISNCTGMIAQLLHSIGDVI
jgi:hypothetical protein